MDDSTEPGAGTKFSEANTQSLMTGQAWHEFCDRLKAAGETVLRVDVPSSRLDRAEGYRQLTRYLAGAIELFIENADPDFPYFSQLPDTRTKFGLDNPDTLYLWTPLRGDTTYRITGKRGTVRYLEFQVCVGIHGVSPLRGGATLGADKLRVEADGSFDLVLSAEPHSGNWLPLEPDATHLMVRQAFMDWDSEETAELRIVSVGKEGEKPRELAPSQMAERLEAVANSVVSLATFWTDFLLAWRRRFGDNILDPPVNLDRSLQGSQSLFSRGYFNIAGDEALIIELAPSDALYWGIHLGNCWFVSLDYANRQTSLTGHQAYLSSDGIHRFVIAHQDPGVPNWLDTAGHGEGAMLFRWTLADSAPQPTSKVVKFNDIRAEFPKDTPYIDEQTRREHIARRQAHVARRYHR